MIDTVTEHTFTDVMATKEHGFSYEGSKALYNYLEEYEESTGEQITFDPVALRCEYSEYKNLNKIIEDYQDIKTLEDLQDHTTVILINESDSMAYPTKQEPRNREQIADVLIANSQVKILDPDLIESTGEYFRLGSVTAMLSSGSLKLIFDTEKQEQKLIEDTYNKQVKEYNKNNIHSYEGIIIQNF